jgi:L-ribulose-5-phosphate 3-epimerase
MKGQGFKIGACDWVLGKISDPGAFAVAKQLGLDGVQVTIGTVAKGMHLTRPQVQKVFLQAAKASQVEIASLALDLNFVPYKSDPRAEKWVADSIDVCKAMDVSVVLLPFFLKAELRGDHKGTDEVIRRLKKVTQRAEDAGVIFGIESYLSAWETKDIIDRVGSPSVQMYYDVGNSHKQDYDIYEEIRWLGNKNICEFHAKDYDFLFGKGKINFPAVRLAMDDIGYRGWIHVEGAKPLGLMKSYKADAEYLKSIFPADAPIKS